MQAKERALEIAAMPKKEQQVALKEEFNKSIETGLKITTEFVSIVKQADGNINENYKKFQESCDITIKALKETLKDGVVTESEKEDVRNKIIQIQAMAATARIEAFNATSETKKAAFDTAGDVAKTTIKTGFLVGGAVAALKIVCDTFLKSKK